jgi:uncharacterized protein (TIGR03435 family)
VTFGWRRPKAQRRSGQLDRKGASRESGPSAPHWALDEGGQKPGNLIGMLSKALNHHVVDKTGITDLYMFHLRFAHDESTLGNLPPAMPERMLPPLMFLQARQSSRR